MKYLVIVLLFIQDCAFAQELLPPINLRSTNIKEFDATAIGDSVLITYSFIQPQSEAELVFRFLIHADKTIESIGLPASVRDIEKVDDKGDKLLLVCSRDDRKETVLSEITFDKSTKSLSQPVEVFRTSRKNLLAIIPMKGLLILSESRKQDSLVISRIDESRQVNQRSFFILEKMLRLVQSDFMPMKKQNSLTWNGGLVPGLDAIIGKQSYSIFSEGRMVTPSQAVADLKFYIEENKLMISRDQPKKSYRGFIGYTSLITIDLENGSMKYGFVGEPVAKAFTSVYSKGHLYRISKERNYKISIFKIDSLMQTIELDKNAIYMNTGKYYKRSDVSVTEELKCSEALYGGEPFVMPRATSSGKMFLKIGSHVVPRSSGGGGVPVAVPMTISTPSGPVAIPMPVGSVGGSSVPVINDLSETVGVDRYFYLYGDPETGFEYSHGQGLLDQQIDDFEMKSEKEQGRFKMKRYLRTKNYTYAFYRQRGDKEIQVVRFKNNL
jgi:hypothetical protein